MCQGVRPEGWLRWFAYPCGGGGVCVGGVCSVSCFCSRHPAFSPGSSKLVVGFFGLFVCFPYNFAPVEPAHGYF